jgi:hypothetical protein
VSHLPFAGRRGPVLPEIPPAPTVSASVGRRFFHDRLTNQYAHHYHLIVSIFKGVALTSGAVALLGIVSSTEDVAVKVTALGLWLASLAAIIATYDGIMVASIVVTAPPNGIDLVAPFVMGLAEFTQFAVLTPLPLDASGTQPIRAAQFAHISWWPLVFAVLAVTACLDIANSRVQIRRNLAEAPLDLQPLLSWYMGNLRESELMTGASALVMVAAFVALRVGPAALQRWQLLIAACVLFGMVNGILSQERARHRIVTSVAPRAGPDPVTAPATPPR